jgi:hypothetical protein
MWSFLPNLPALTGEISLEQIAVSLAMVVVFALGFNSGNTR